MIDNPRRQILLVLVVAIAALIGAFGEPRWGVDLAGGTILTYDIPSDEIGPDADLDQLMTDTVRVLEDRLDPAGILDASVLRRGDTGLRIEIPALAGQDLASIEARIQNLGRLEMRILATEDYSDGDGILFDLPEEKSRLERWLDEEGGTRRTLLAADPTHIDDFTVRTGSTSGSLSSELRWYPRVIRPSTLDGEAWDYASALDTGASSDFAVAVFTEAQWLAGPNADGAPEFLVEFLPVNMQEMFFSGEDLDASGIHPTTDSRGLPAVAYLLKAIRQGEYASWSHEHIGDKSAIILDGVIQSAPVFENRILGHGIVRGGFTVQDVRELVAVLKSGSLEVKPVLQAKQTIRATLGASAINRGFLSIAAGGVLVLVFILVYYRLAGVVAFAGIALNVLLIWGVLQFLRATLTLPGIAGMVLTMGMAVDANILIYERIREELARGKALLQAVRAGFRRAMVTILDANVTTFIAGVVLYNIGVGPIRGFAVTLMVGIVTTLFTAFFVSRLVFHYLLVLGKLRNFKASHLFGRLRFDFLGPSRTAVVASLVLIVSGLVYSIGFVPRDTLLGLDFTGGANLQISLQEPTTPAEVRGLFESRASGEHPVAVVNPLGELNAQDRYREFNVKLKLSEKQREAIALDRRRAAIDGEDYTPPYITHLQQVLADVLVAPAYSDARIDPDPLRRPVGYASLYLHFSSPVARSDLSGALQRLPNVHSETVAGEPATEARHWLVEWDVPEDTRLTELFPTLREHLGGLEDSEGNPILLSNPFPEAEEISGRLVGELRSAAIGAMVLSMFLIVMYMRIRFREYKYGIAAVAALVHDVLVSFGVLAFVNAIGLVSAELNLAMIAAFLTIIGYSINDTIVIFDRIRENLDEGARLGSDREAFRHLINRSINQTLSRTILTSGTTLFVVLAQFAVNYGSGSALEGFSFALILGVLTGTYSTMFIAAPLVLRLHEGGDSLDPTALQTSSASLPSRGSVQGGQIPCEPSSTSRLPGP